jgi:hypothetical protein
LLRVRELFSGSFLRAAQSPCLLVLLGLE